MSEMFNLSKSFQPLIIFTKSFILEKLPTNTPRVFLVELTWKRVFPRRFNAEYTRSVCRATEYFKLMKRETLV